MLNNSIRGISRLLALTRWRQMDVSASCLLTIQIMSQMVGKEAEVDRQTYRAISRKRGEKNVEHTKMAKSCNKI